MNTINKDNLGTKNGKVTSTKYAAKKVAVRRAASWSLWVDVSDDCRAHGMLLLKNRETATATTIATIAEHLTCFKRRN